MYFSQKTMHQNVPRLKLLGKRAPRRSGPSDQHAIPSFKIAEFEQIMHFCLKHRGTFVNRINVRKAVVRMALGDQHLRNLAEAD